MKKYFKIILSTIFLTIMLIGCGKSSNIISTCKKIVMFNNLTVEEAVNIFYKSKGDTKIDWKYLKDDEAILITGEPSKKQIFINLSVDGSSIGIYKHHGIYELDNQRDLENYINDINVTKTYNQKWKYIDSNNAIWTSKDIENKEFINFFIYGFFMFQERPTEATLQGLEIPANNLKQLKSLNTEIKNVNEKYKLHLEDKSYAKYTETGYSKENTYYPKFASDTNTELKYIDIYKTFNKNTNKTSIKATVNGSRETTEKLLKAMDVYDKIYKRGKYKN